MKYCFLFFFNKNEIQSLKDEIQPLENEIQKEKTSKKLMWIVFVIVFIILFVVICFVCFQKKTKQNALDQISFVKNILLNFEKDKKKTY
jgi:flagellar basal body-associated protein FliL